MSTWAESTDTGWLQNACSTARIWPTSTPQPLYQDAWSSWTAATKLMCREYKAALSFTIQPIALQDEQAKHLALNYACIHCMTTLYVLRMHPAESFLCASDKVCQPQVKEVLPSTHQRLFRRFVLVKYVLVREGVDEKSNAAWTIKATSVFMSWP